MNKREGRGGGVGGCTLVFTELEILPPLMLPTRLLLRDSDVDGVSLEC